VTIVDKLHGSPLPEWEKMGRPRNPTKAQIITLQKAAALPAVQRHALTNGSLTITLAAHGLALVSVK
jgi:hypothetical protein